VPPLNTRNAVDVVKELAPGVARLAATAYRALAAMAALSLLTGLSAVTMVMSLVIATVTTRIMPALELAKQQRGTCTVAEVMRQREDRSVRFSRHPATVTCPIQGSGTATRHTESHSAAP
jgi:hypothetical protein